MIAMTRRLGRTRREGWRPSGLAPLVLSCLALLTVGCGNNGDITVKIPEEPGEVVGAIRGTIYAPNGEIARANKWPSWLEPFNLLPKAYAALNPNVLPIGPGAEVYLTQVLEIDASDGEIDSPLPINGANTNVEGQYKILDHAADNVDACRLMISVGDRDQLARAFAVSTITDVDTASEATVRVVLNRLTQAPPAHLCDFDTQELIRLLDIVANATFTASGDTLYEMNRDAYELAVNDICVQDAIEKATDTDSGNTPSGCLRFYPPQ